MVKRRYDLSRGWKAAPTPPGYQYVFENTVRTFKPLLYFIGTDDAADLWERLSSRE